MPYPPPIARRRIEPWLMAQAIIYQRRSLLWRRPNRFTTNPGVQDYVVLRTLAVGGTAPSKPRYTVTYPSGAGYGITQISITNLTAAPDRPLTVRRTFTPGDILVADAETYDVTVEDSTLRPVFFSGRIPLLDPCFGPTNIIEFRILATSQPSLIPLIEWVPRFLS